MINLVQLSNEGKSFKWEKQFCKNCSRCMWGHGFAARYFESFSVPLYMKRFRCPNCKAVATTRPQGFWNLIRTEIESVFNTLYYRLTHSADPPVWPTGFPRQRGGYWLRKWTRYFKMHFSKSSDDLIRALLTLKIQMQSFFA